MDFYTVEPCVTSNAFELKFVDRVKIDLEKASVILGKIGEVLAKTPVVLVLKANHFNASVYASGRIMMKNVEKEEAEQLGREIVEMLEKGGAFQ
jgi:predicted Ser/Thr protein kinase